MVVSCSLATRTRAQRRERTASHASARDELGLNELHPSFMNVDDAPYLICLPGPRSGCVALGESPQVSTRVAGRGMASSRGSGSADATNASRVSLVSADENISPNDAPALRSALEASSAAFAAQAAEIARLRSRLDSAGLGATVAPPAGFGRSAAKACDGAEHRRREVDDATIELPPHDSADDSEAETVCSTDALTALQFLPDVLLLGVLDFNDNLSRGSLFIASKVLATRLRQARGTVIAGLNSDHLNEQIKASTQLRMLLSGINPPIQMVIDAGVVPRLVQFVREDFEYVVSPSPKLQLEAAWILAQIVSSTSDHIRVVVEEDGVPIFCSLMGSRDESTRLRAASALGLMAIESPTYRDMVLEEGMMELLPDHIREDLVADGEQSIRSLRALVALLTQLCRGDPPLELYRVAPALEVFATLIRSKDEEVLSSTCQGLTYISAHGDIERTQAIIEEGVCPRLVELLGHTSREVVYDALHTLGNMISSDHVDHTEFILNLPLLPRLSKLLDHDDVKICNDTVWTIGNICAGSLGQIQAVLDFDGLVPQVINLLIHSDAGIRKEAAYVVDNVIERESRNQIAVLISHGCIPLLCKLLKNVKNSENGRVRDDIQETMRVALNSFKCLARVTLSTVTRSPDHVLSFAYVHGFITDEGGLERINFLRGHHNREISELAIEVSDLFATSVRADQRALWRANVTRS